MAPVWYSLSASACLLVDEAGVCACASQMPGSKTIINNTLGATNLAGNGKVLVRNIRRFTSHFSAITRTADNFVGAFLRGRPGSGVRGGRRWTTGSNATRGTVNRSQEGEPT